MVEKFEGERGCWKRLHVCACEIARAMPTKKNIFLDVGYVGSYLHLASPLDYAYYEIIKRVYTTNTIS
jgi:hypothetical protein